MHQVAAALCRSLFRAQLYSWRKALVVSLEVSMTVALLPF
jgi:hypothetical protein